MFFEQFKSRRLAVTPRITIQELAAAAHVGVATVHAIETGARENPGIRKVAAIETALTQLEAQRKAQQTIAS